MSIEEGSEYEVAGALASGKGTAFLTLWATEGKAWNWKKDAVTRSATFLCRTRAGWEFSIQMAFGWEM